MFKKNSQGFYYFEELKKYPDIIHGISTRKFGDCRRSAKKFLNALNLETNNLVLMEQVHGNNIKVLSQEDKGKVIPQVDGIVSQEPRVILGVKSADCPNILFFEPRAKIIAVCHAGWRCLVKKLPTKMIDLMILKGAEPGNIVVTIGPHIKECCYEVKDDVAQKFEQSDIKDHRLDLTKVIIRQLVHSGIKEKNIFDSVCNACNLKEFYSYRKDVAKKYGEILSIISLK